MIACSTSMMWFLVNADFAKIYWSFMGRIPFTLCVMANSTAAEIYNLAYMGFILTAYILSCVEIRCVNVSICIADHIGGMLFHFNYKSTIKKW